MIWTILGISVAIVAVFCITVAETLVGVPAFEQSRPYAAVGLGVLGAIAWFLGRTIASRDEEAAGRRFVLMDLRYWGPMFVVLGVITLFIRPLKTEKQEKPLVAARPVQKAPQPVAVAKKVEPPKVAAPEPAAPVVFPKFKMGGIIFREQQPFVIMNGDSYTVGDHIGGVLVKAIDRTSVILELGGEIRVLTLN